MLTLPQFRLAMPACPAARAAAMFPPMAAAMARADINTPLRAAAFISQVGHESLDLLYMNEIASGAAYEGRKDLGNVLIGDGKRFKGRGPLQITGRANYVAFAKWSGLDCVDHPELLEVPANGFLASAWFWLVNNVNKWADLGDIDGVSDVINRGKKSSAYGDSNGFSDRKARYDAAMKALA